MKKAAFIGDGHQIARVYHGETMASLRRELDFIADGTCLVKSDFDAVKEELAAVEYVFSTWGMLALAAEEIREYLAGNLCRCSGYEGQLRAIQSFLAWKRAKEAGE